MLLPVLRSPRVFSTILYIITGFSLPIHLFGGYCILFKTPVIMKSVKWSLFNLHFWSAALDLTISFFAQPFICTPALAGYAMGFLPWLGVNMYVLVYIGITLFIFVPVSIIGMLENRYFQIFAQQSQWRYFRYPFLFINYLWAILYCVPVILDIPNQEYARIEVFHEYPQIFDYESVESKIFVITLDFTRTALQQSIFTVLVLEEAFAFVGLIRVNMNKVMKEVHSSLSKHTVHMHKAFIKALNLQIAIPLIILFAPTIIGVLFRTIISNHQGFNNVVYICSSLHGVLSTLIMIYLQNPYRAVVKRIFCQSSQGSHNIVSNTKRRKPEGVVTFF
ncbi:Serpentine Receptor, class H [Caenorhabditis elegans]|uniref:Serpentine Receptor, class H n=1 Tax=Caenorhabditis elegans TaxID=6239 RepID=Q9GRZ8_CAEEL|nr:Serpentine Receptor, class H [Caenorhabditis elegans]CAC14401.1 Serpentine Receptor, class H [Caenorhabditis elegans]|eukprot:NP_507505.1 Serpentine Receptor, class H [Caenorhabditis elegans]